MTDPIRYDRRQFLHRAGLAGAASAVATFAPRPPARADEDLAPFLHGVASGDPTSDAVVIWTRLTTDEPEAVVQWEVATDLDLHDVVASGHTTASANRDHTVKVDVTGLPAGTWLYYRFLHDGRSSLVGRTRTAPSGSLARARFGVVSCSNYQHGFFNAYARLAEREDLDAILHLGDYLYEYQVVADGGYGEDESNLAAPRRHDPPVEMVDRAGYRTRHAQYKLDPDLRRLHQLFPWVTTWDDHESTNNAHRDGAENHDDTEGDWQTRKDISRQVYDEWMPTRTDDPARLWRSFQWGDLLDLIVLDTRLERDAIIGTQGATVLADEVDDPNRVMLSDEQRAFLYDALTDGGTAWKVIQQQVIMAPWNAAAFPTTGPTQDMPIPVVRDDGNSANPDQWDGYTAERRRLFDHIRDNGIEDVVVLTGDVHSSWAIDLTETPFDPTLYDPVTGEGAVGVEFVCTSVTSSGPAIFGPELVAIEAGTRADNPHVKWTNFSERGYLILDVTPERAQADWWLVDTVLAPSDGQQHGASWMSVRGDNHLTEAEAAVANESRVPPAPAGDPPATAGPADGDDAGDSPSLPVTGGGVALAAAAIGAGGFLRLVARRNDMEHGR